MPVAFTDQQQAVIEAIVSTQDNIMGNAYAGTGKTTTLQAAIDLMIAGGKRPRYVYTTFTSMPIKQMQQRGYTAYTLNKIGNDILRAHFGASYKLDQWQDYSIAREVLRFTGLSREDFKEATSTMVRMMSLCRSLLINWNNDEQMRDELGVMFDERFDPLLALLPDAMRKVMDKISRGSITLGDQIFAPVILELPTIAAHEYDMLIVDEAQDLSPLMRAMLDMLGNRARIVGMGDERQAIMAFAGADQHAFSKLIDAYDMRIMPLSHSFRFGQVIADHVQRYAPGIKGVSGQFSEIETHDTICENTFSPGDALLTRTNAEAVQIAVRLFREHVPIQLAGRDDMGESMIRILHDVTVKPYDFRSLPSLLKDHERAKVAKMRYSFSDPQKVEQFSEECDTLRNIINMGPYTSVDEVIQHIQSVFAARGSVTISTMHKAKGLEWPRVFFMGHTKFFERMTQQKRAEDVRQEENLYYVACTRPMQYLGLVASEDVFEDDDIDVEVGDSEFERDTMSSAAIRWLTRYLGDSRGEHSEM